MWSLCKYDRRTVNNSNAVKKSMFSSKLSRNFSSLLSIRPPYQFIFERQQRSNNPGRIEMYSSMANTRKPRHSTKRGSIAIAAQSIQGNKQLLNPNFLLRCIWIVLKNRMSAYFCCDSDKTDIRVTSHVVVFFKNEILVFFCVCFHLTRYKTKRKTKIWKIKISKKKLRRISFSKFATIFGWIQLVSELVSIWFDLPFPTSELKFAILCFCRGLFFDR